jgi:hypothetical protein
MRRKFRQLPKTSKLKLYHLREIVFGLLFLILLLILIEYL